MRSLTRLRNGYEVAAGSRRYYPVGGSASAGVLLLACSLANPRVLILDEATASLDIPRSAVQAALRTVLAGVRRW